MNRLEPKGVVTEKCRKEFPNNKEIRCRENKDHEGNCIVKGKVVSNKRDWDNVEWQWKDDKIIKEPEPSTV